MQRQNYDNTFTVRKRTALDDKTNTDLMFPVGSVVSHGMLGDGVVEERFDNKMIRVKFPGNPTVFFSNETAPKKLKLKKPNYTDDDLKLIKSEVKDGRDGVLRFIVDSLGFNKAREYLGYDIVNKIENGHDFYSVQPSNPESSTVVFKKVEENNPKGEIEKKSVIDDNKRNKAAISVIAEHSKSAITPKKENWPHGIISVLES